MPDIEYQQQPTRPDNSAVIAVVNEGGYGVAHGPQGKFSKIEYLATLHVKDGLAVAFVTKRPGEDYPRVALGHFESGDSNIKILHTVAAMLRGIEYQRGKKAQLYFVTEGLEDNTEKRELAKNVRRALKHSPLFEVFADYEPVSARQLIIDLSTGQPVDMMHYAHLHTYEVSDKVIAKRVFNDTNNDKDKPLLLEIDMRKGIPTQDLVLVPNKLNPVPLRAIQLES